MTVGQSVINFIEKFCIVPEGDLAGQPFKLEDFQKRFILDIYDNDTRRAYLSIARKNGKTGLIAALLIAHLVGPVALLNSRIASGALSKKQAALIFDAAAKMVNMSPALSARIDIKQSAKRLIGIQMNTEYQALSSEAGSNHGLSLVLVILDEVGQFKGPHSAFVEAVETSQGAYKKPLLIAISTQAATDADLFSLWLDAPDDPHTVKHVYSAPEDCDLLDTKAWEAANPALSTFRNRDEIERFAKEAMELPSKENSFRWLFLNQRINVSSPFISKTAWQDCGTPIGDWKGQDVYAGLDLSQVADLTALVLAYRIEDVWNLKPFFWLPEDGIVAKSKADRVPYDTWAKQPKDEEDKFVELTPGPSIQYAFVAKRLGEIHRQCNLKMVAFDRYKYQFLVGHLRDNGFSEEELVGKDAIFKPFNQGFPDFAPALNFFEDRILNSKIAHGDNPCLNMCMANSRIVMNEYGDRKFTKKVSTGRIDGAVASAMALSVAETYSKEAEPTFSYYFG